jgi:DNA-binding CsgD family transcriptional regulator
VHAATSPTATTSLELTIEIIRLVRAGGTFVPTSSLSLQRYTTTEQFTPRQMAVLHYLTLGKAHKTIAHELALSEGTIKAHSRNIMKKMGVTNRSEVACRAQALATFRADVTGPEGDSHERTRLRTSTRWLGRVYPYACSATRKMDQLKVTPVRPRRLKTACQAAASECFEYRTLRQAMNCVAGS